MMLRLENVSKNFGAVAAISNVSFAVQKGEVLGIMGPNGAGKTTLFNLIMGEFPLDRGTIHFEDKPIHGLSSHEIAAMGLGRTYQIPQPYRGMTVVENLMVGDMFGGRHASLSRARRRAYEILDRVGLADSAEKIAGSLGLLDLKRLELAKALAMNPRLLLLDEIAGGLVENEIVVLRDILEDLKKEGVTMLVIEHVMGILFDLSDRIVVLNFGQLIAQGTAKEVMEEPQVIEAYLGTAHAQEGRDGRPATGPSVAAAMPAGGAARGAPSIDAGPAAAASAEAAAPTGFAATAAPAESAEPAVAGAFAPAGSAAPSAPAETASAAGADTAASPGTARAAASAAPAVSVQPLLEVVSVTAGYDKFIALFDVSLEIYEGEITGLIGVNGAGKTSLIRAITKGIPLMGGTVRYKGIDLATVEAHKLAELGISQSIEGRKIFPELTVLENLELGAYNKRARQRRKQTLREVFDLFPILEEKKNQLGTLLSGGQQQMLAIGRALMSLPDFLILDEVSLGLAPVVIDQLYKAIVEINRRGTTILLVEQSIQRCLDTVHRAYVMEHGRIVLSGTAEELKNNEEFKKAYFGV
ncbi:MAG TPA: ATP-binding cassette domain-containing protein [Paenibacillaceae bacterium]